MNRHSALLRAPLLPILLGLSLTTAAHGRQIFPEDVTLVYSPNGDVYGLAAEAVENQIKVVATDSEFAPAFAGTFLTFWGGPVARWTPQTLAPPPVDPPAPTANIGKPNVCSTARDVSFGGPPITTDFVVVVEESTDRTGSKVRFRQIPEQGSSTVLTVSKGTGLVADGTVLQITMGCSAMDCDNDNDIDQDDIVILVLMRIDDGTGIDKAVLSRRHGQGDFETGVIVSDPLVNVDDLSLAVDESCVHLVWTEDTGLGGNDLIKQTRDSCDALTVPAGKKNLGATTVETFRAHFRGAVAEVAWVEPQVGGNGILISTTSFDNCQTFSGPESVGEYDEMTDTVFSVDSHVLTSDDLLLTWADDRFGGSTIFAALSIDGGATWTESMIGVGSEPGIVEGSGSSVAIHWIDGTTSQLMAALSADGGQTWSAGTSLSDGAAVSEPVGVFEPFYERFSYVWLADLGGIQAPYSGGFRAQSLTPINWTPGAFNVGFGYAGFEPAAFALAGVSATPGSFVLNGQEWGILPDALFVSLLTSFVAITDPVGNASMTIPGPVPPGVGGLTLYSLGIGFDVLSSTVNKLTSVVEIVL